MVREKCANRKRRDFVLRAPAAGSVQLVGDFTRWQEHPIRMRRDADGTWRVTVELETGVHQYRFLVDGQWRDDPESPLRVRNPYGTEDSVCRVI
jgi:1,4-alpha-glucan branching enzyme